MTCKPCRVTFEGQRYQIFSDGQVSLTWIIEEDMTDGAAQPTGEKFKTRMFGAKAPATSDVAKLVRQEAARQRRNRNARDRHQGMKDLGLVRVRGNLGGVYYE